MTCLVCQTDAVREELNVGEHPVSSFFVSERNDTERKYRVALGQCTRCGTIQLVNPIPHSALVAPYPWIVAREPEDHLDRVVEQITSTPGIDRNSVIGALTSKDDTTVDRLKRKGYLRTWRIRLDQDLEVSNPCANIETVQKLTTPERMARVAERLGAADVLIVRHVLEHAEDVQAFVHGLAALLKPGGLAVVEVPDCSRSLELHDYCMIWEEHSLYLTPETFAPLLTIGPFSPVRMDVYQYPFENSLVQFARKMAAPQGAARGADGSQFGLLARYAQHYEPARRYIRGLLERVRAEQGRLALFGAGHLACAFVIFMDVADLFDYVVDDTPQKQGKFLPGARLPIVPSAALVEAPVALCLLATSIGSEEAILARNAQYLRRGGKFRSVLRASPRSIFDGLG